MYIYIYTYYAHSIVRGHAVAAAGDQELVARSAHTSLCATGDPGKLIKLNNQIIKIRIY